MQDVDWLREVQQPPALPTNERLPRLFPINADLASWQKNREEIRRQWLQYLGPLDRPKSPPETELLNEEHLEKVIRQLIRYESEPGWSTEAYVVRPKGVADRPRPAVVVFHSTVPHSIRQPAGVEGTPEKAFGLNLAEKGFVTFCPRNFLWPNNLEIAAEIQTELFQERHPNSKGMAKMLLDAQLAVDLLLSLPGVDESRIGAVGHSLGAKEVVYLAAFDQRIQVTVSSEGGIGTTFSNWDDPWYLGPGIKAFALDHEHHELLALIAPRPFLLVGGESADGQRSWPFIEAVLPVYRLYENVPRIGLFTHGQGHSVPPIAEQRIYDWLETYLGVDRVAN